MAALRRHRSSVADSIRDGVGMEFRTPDARSQRRYAPLAFHYSNCAGHADAVRLISAKNEAYEMNASRLTLLARLPAAAR
jgi:hypothetical protein